MKQEDILSRKVIAAAIEAHRHTGPGLLESVYEACLCSELAASGIRFERQVTLPVSFKGRKLDFGYRIDLVVDKLVILEIKAVDQLMPIHTAQLLTYLRQTGLHLGILLNFN